MQKPTQNFRIDKISIRNYKGIDSLDLEFPRPKFPNDPDIFVIGSRNGLGKTSVLECCAWGLMMNNLIVTTNASVLSGNVLTTDEDVYNDGAGFHLSMNEYSLSPSPIRCSATFGKATMTISSNPSTTLVRGVRFTKDSIQFNTHENTMWLEFFQESALYEEKSPQVSTSFFKDYLDQSSNPTIERLFLFFPDNRFIHKGSVPLKVLQSGKKETVGISEFKIQALEAIMGKSGLLEGQDKNVSEERFEFLNNLIKDFTDCELSPQLKQGADSSLDIRVRSKTGNDSPSLNTYSFDGLSSGQKEMISTLFLIWENTRNASKVVLIDEPEQHLNAEWHRFMIHKLCEVAPWNQYIIATHSEHIMDAVDEDRRILLVKRDKGNE